MSGRAATLDGARAAEPAAGPASRAATIAVFTSGSVVRHVTIMTATATVGFMAVLIIDLLSMVYISLSGNDAERAAVSLAAKVLFFPYALHIGLSVGIAATVAFSLGRGAREEARQRAGLGLLLIGGSGVLVAVIAFVLRDTIIAGFGVEGETATLASRMLTIMLPANPFLGLGMGAAAILRAAGDARRSMLASVLGAAVIAVLDPLLIVGLSLGTQGVAISTLAARIAFALAGIFWAAHRHGLVALPAFGGLSRRARALTAIALPAVVSNLALPFADWYTTATIWRFGIAPAAAQGVFDRLMPVAFALIFAMVGAVGPIFSQNLGAGLGDRVKAAFRASLALATGYGLTVWAILWVVAPALRDGFALEGEAAAFFLFLCRWGTLAWLFVSLLFVANAVFNNLGRAWLAMLFNWGRATVGTIPLVWLGAHWWGPEAAIMGLATSAFVFSASGLFVAWRVACRAAAPEIRPRAKRTATSI